MAESRRFRILIVTRNLPPLVGGMEQLNWHLAEELARTASVRLLGPRGSSACAPSHVPVDEVAIRPLWRFFALTTLKAIRIATSWRPDVIVAGSGLTAPMTWIAARLSGAKAVLYAHGLDLAVSHPVYRFVWHPVLRRMDRVIANSRATASLAQNIGIERDRVVIVPPGVDTHAVPEGQLAGKGFQEVDCHQPVLLSVGRLSTRKGVKEFVTEVLPLVVAKYPGAVLWVVGDVPRDALAAAAQNPDQIQAAADASGVGKNIKFLGVITDRERLSALYRSADVHIFPVRHIANDPEGFGMVAVEAAAHGLPTVAYATGGIVDAVSDGVTGRLVPSGDATGFADAVRQMIESPPPVGPAQAFASEFAWERFGERVMEALAGGAGHEQVRAP